MFTNLFQHVLFGETKGLHVESLEVEADQIEVVAVSILSEAQCPVCGQRNSRVQSHSVRCVTDGGWSGMSVRIKLEVRRFYCDWEQCERRIFTERLPGVVRAHGRRTERQESLLEVIVQAEGGERGARTAARFGMGSVQIRC